MEDYSSAPSKGFIWGVVIATVVVVAVVAFIFKAVTPAGPAASAPEQTASAPVATAPATTAPAGEANETAPAAGSKEPAPEAAQASSSQAATPAQAMPDQDRADAGGTAQAAASEETQMMQVAFTGDSGAALYVQACQSCHMPGGRGADGAGMYPALANNARAASTPYVASLILNGNGGMPSFGYYLNDQQIAMIVNYVRGDLNDQDSDVQPQEIKELRPKNPDYILFGEGAG